MTLKVYNRRNLGLPKWLKELVGWALGWAFRNDSQKTPDLTHQGSHYFCTTWANDKNFELLWIQTSELELSLIIYVTLCNVLNLARIKIWRSCHYSNCFSILTNWLMDLSPPCCLYAKQSPKKLENSLCFTFTFQITQENLSLVNCIQDPSCKGVWRYCLCCFY